jgi:hypothetical protein
MFFVEHNAFVSCFEVEDEVDHPGGPAFTMVGTKEKDLHWISQSRQ